MYRFFILCLFTFALSFSSFSGIIEGFNKDYAGKELKFYTLTDPVTKQQKFLFSTKFSQDGKFSYQMLKEDKSIYIYCDFGIYRGMFLTEPHKDIILKFPPFREKTFGDKKNPFFKPVQFWFNTENKEDLSSVISAFNLKFNEQTSRYFNQLFFHQSASIRDSIISGLNTDFGAYNSAVFKLHREFRIKGLEMDVNRLKTEDISEIFNGIPSQYWNHPAFTELFEKSFSNTLSFEANQINGGEIKAAVAKADINYLLNFLKRKFKLNGNIRDLVLLKALHDAFYSGEFAQSPVLQMLNSGYFSKNQDNTIKTISGLVVKKLKHLQPGTLSPPVCLENFTGDKICTDSTSDKFKYLIFADAEMIVCREHLKYLATIDQRFNKHLEIFIIHRNTNVDYARKFISENKIKGTQLIDKDESFIQTYKIKSYPSCFLLDENHRILFKQTKAPLDGFEQQFGEYLRAELFRRQRNQSR